MCPESWPREKAAGPDWYANFINRRSSLSLRKPEATSQARAAGYNFVVVNRFQKLLNDILIKSKFPPYRIFNGDETSSPTVLEPRKVVAERGVKQVSVLIILLLKH